MDFGALPPEINSGRMYVGAGAAPMLTASTTWDVVGSELRMAATAFRSVVTELTAGQWLGPASMSMAAATAPYVAWMHATAEVAEQTAVQAKTAAAAYETAFAMTVPPPVIAANRAALMALIATNFFGQNTAAIAANEALYAEMWAQDATAMYTYQGSTLASALTPFTPPESTDDATELPPGNAAEPPPSTAPKLPATPPRPIQEPVPPTTPPPTKPTPPPGPLEFYTTHIHHTDAAFAATRYIFGVGDKGYKLFGSSAPKASGDAAKAAAGAAGLPGLGGVVGGAAGGSPVSAGLGKAASVGGVSVPSSWTPTVAPSKAPLPPAPVPDVSAAKDSGLLRGIPLTGAGRRSGGDGFVHRYGFRYNVIPRSPAAG